MAREAHNSGVANLAAAQNITSHFQQSLAALSESVDRVVSTIAESSSAPAGFTARPPGFKDCITLSVTIAAKIFAAGEP